MRTILIIVGGLVLLGIALFLGRWMGGTPTMVTFAKVFVLVWLAVAALNMWMGVSRAGYSVAEEFPIFLVIFALPAAVALVIWWKWS
jgi:hypothetical protein